MSLFPAPERDYVGFGGSNGPLADKLKGTIVTKPGFFVRNNLNKAKKFAKQQASEVK